jgi:hypothetical protein
MSDKPNMLSLPDPWDLVASGYAETTMGDTWPNIGVK